MRRIGYGVLSSRTNFLNMQNTCEIIVYRPDETDIHIPVRVDKETVWLNRHQLSILFQRDVKTIGKHIAKALTEELHMLPVVAKFATTATDGKSYQVEHYNLDVVISVGYRVKSAKGVQFRITHAVLARSSNSTLTSTAGSTPQSPLKPSQKAMTVF